MSALVFGGACGGAATRGGRDHESRDDHPHLIPATVGQGRCAIGKPARLDLARHTSFMAAWREGLSPHEAVADAKSRSNAQRLPRWRMLEAIGVNGRARPGTGRDCRRRNSSHTTNRSSSGSFRIGSGFDTALRSRGGAIGEEKPALGCGVCCGYDVALRAMALADRRAAIRAAVPAGGTPLSILDCCNRS